MIWEEFRDRGLLGLIKVKGGDTLSLAPERFVQMKPVSCAPWTMLRKNIFAYVIFDGVYWLLCKEGEGEYTRILFAKNEVWYRAISSEAEFAFVRGLPQVYITRSG